MAEPVRLFLVAAEASGDALGADLIEALRALDPDCTIAGIGGAAMTRAGVPSAMVIDGLAVLGFTDALAAWKRVEQKADEAASAILAAAPDVVVLIDSWGFTIRVARRVKAARPDLPVIKMVGPQVWATRPGRAKTVAEAYDGLLCIHDFEVPFYEGTSLPVRVIGNPAVGREMGGYGAGFRARHGLEGRKLLLLLPGSRGSELKRVAPVLEAATARLCAADPDLMAITVVAGAVADGVRARASGWGFPHLLVEEGEKADAFAACEVSLACSGTVTTEVAMAGGAVVTGYKAGWITWAIARAFLMRAKFITLINVAAGREVIPEFVQTRFTPVNLGRTVQRLLDAPEDRARQVEAQNEALIAMGRGGEPAAAIAARAILDRFWADTTGL